MNINVKRMPGAGIAVGGHIFGDDDGFEAPFDVAAIRLRVEFAEDEIQDEGDGMFITLMLTRDEAHAMGTAMVDCLCDG